MSDQCHLWTNLSSSGPRAHAHTEPVAYLHFPSTGLVVGLPDEPGYLIDPGGSTKSFALREVDASGLGLTDADLTEGVAFCSGVEGEPGWRCDSVDLIVSDSQGEFRSMGAMAEPPPLEPVVEPLAVPSHTGRPRALVYVTARALDSGGLADVAARARQLDARVVLGAVGELPESRRHADEEQRTLHRLLVDAAVLFGGRVAALRVELGGDPVQSLLAIAEQEHASLILIAEDAVARSHVDGLARQVRRRAGIPVKSVAHLLSETGHVSTAAAGASAGREHVMRRLAIAIGAHEVSPPWERPEAWRELVGAAVRDRLDAAAPVPAGAECSLTARWFVHADHPRPEDLTQWLPVATIAEALVNAEYIAPSQLAASRTRVEVVETDGDLVEHVVAVLRC